MKKVIIIALCILGICNAHAETMTAQEIILTEIATMLPWDSNDEEKDLIRPNIGQTEFHASIDGNHLSIGAYTNMPAYVEVIDEETGEVVADEEFEGETEFFVENAGSYIVQIYSGNTVMTGEFEVE